LQFPTILCMAWDYLAIQGFSMPSEQAFSSGGLIATTRHNRLLTESFESLQLLKSAYQNGHIAAVKQAVAHLKDLWKNVGSEETEEMDIV